MKKPAAAADGAQPRLGPGRPRALMLAVLLAASAATTGAFLLPPPSLPAARLVLHRQQQRRVSLVPPATTAAAAGEGFWLDPTADAPLQDYPTQEASPAFAVTAASSERPPAPAVASASAPRPAAAPTATTTAAAATAKRAAAMGLSAVRKATAAAAASSTTAAAGANKSRVPAVAGTALRGAGSDYAVAEAGGGNSQGQQQQEGPVQALAALLSSESSKKLAVWLGFLGLGWQLRSFYGIILGTFVLSYIGSSAVRFSEEKGNRLLEKAKLPRLPRRAWALLYICVVLNAILSLTILTVPRVVGETNYLSLIIESENPYVFVADGIRSFLGPDVSAKLEAFLLTVTGEEGRAFAAGVLTASSGGAAGGGGGGSGAVEAARAAAAKAVGGLGDVNGGVWTAARKSRFAKLMEFSLKGYIKQGYYVVQKLVGASTKLVYKGLLSLLFSFMVIWDLPRLGVGVRKLAHSRFGFAYQVLAPQITSFAKLVGQSFEVQSIIALVNTILTTLGLVLLKIPGYGFLSLVVLITSFIPVFGVFLSTFPMALVALSEYGVRKLLDVILMVIGIHVVEAYCLSPLIYSATVKLHPVLIVAALYMMEHLAGLQGVFLAVPITMFVIKQVIFGNNISNGSEQQQQQQQLAAGGMEPSFSE